MAAAVLDTVPVLQGIAEGVCFEPGSRRGWRIRL